MLVLVSVLFWDFKFIDTIYKNLWTYRAVIQSSLVNAFKRVWQVMTYFGIEIAKMKNADGTSSNLTILKFGMLVGFV